MAVISAYYGGGISASRYSYISVINSTISGNSADYGGGISINNLSSLSLTNSLVSGNLATEAAEIENFNDRSYITTDGVNVFGDSRHTNAQSFAYVTTIGDITATSDGSNPTRLSSILAPLADNGGSTQTHALIDLSPAINSGDNSNCGTGKPIDFDQRGVSRDDGLCDIGSFEGFVNVTLENPQTFVVPLNNGKVVIFDL